MKKLILAAMLAALAPAAGATEVYSADLNTLTIEETTCVFVVGEPVLRTNTSVLLGYRRHYACTDQTTKVRFFPIEKMEKRFPDYKSVGE